MKETNNPREFLLSGAIIIISTWLLTKQKLHHLDSRIRDGGTRTEDASYASLLEEVVVLSGNHATGGDHDVLAAQLVGPLGQGCIVALVEY